jgi:hypothetical protein
MLQCLSFLVITCPSCLWVPGAVASTQCKQRMCQPVWLCRSSSSVNGYHFITCTTHAVAKETVAAGQQHAVAQAAVAQAATGMLQPGSSQQLQPIGHSNGSVCPSTATYACEHSTKDHSQSVGVSNTVTMLGQATQSVTGLCWSLVGAPSCTIAQCLSVRCSSK